MYLLCVRNVCVLNSLFLSLAPCAGLRLLSAHSFSSSVLLYYPLVLCANMFGGDAKLLDQIFNLKFTAKQLVRNAAKAEKEEKSEKLKVSYVILYYFKTSFSVLYAHPLFAIFMEKCISSFSTGRILWIDSPWFFYCVIIKPRWIQQIYGMVPSCTLTQTRS